MRTNEGQFRGALTEPKHHYCYSTIHDPARKAIFAGKPAKTLGLNKPPLPGIGCRKGLVGVGFAIDVAGSYHELFPAGGRNRPGGR